MTGPDFRHQVITGHDFWSPTQPILPPRHDYGHQVMTGHDHVMTLSHELKSRELKPLEDCDVVFFSSFFFFSIDFQGFQLIRKVRELK